MQDLVSDEHFGKRPWKRWLAEGLDRLGWARPDAATDVLAGDSGPVPHPGDPKRREGQPRVFLGPIASANTLLKDPAKRDALRDQFGARAVEMEGSGIADATWTHGIGYLVVRGICDYCDATKNDTWQMYAAMAAAAYVRPCWRRCRDWAMVGRSRMHTTYWGRGAPTPTSSGPSPSRSLFPAVGPAPTPPRIVPHKLFISYAHGDPDQMLAHTLREGLRVAGHEVFIDTAAPLGPTGAR